MHPDRTTYNENLDYFVLRAGPLAVALQQGAAPPYSPYALLLWRPEEFVRKESTWLFHPEGGGSGTMASLLCNGVRYFPPHDRTVVSWEDRSAPDSAILIEWTAGPLRVRERLAAIPGDGGLRRQISVELFPGEPVPDEEVTLILSLTPNPLLFPGLPQHPPESNTLVITNRKETESVLRVVASQECDLPSSLDTFERFFQLTGTVNRENTLSLCVDYHASDDERRPRVRYSPDAPGSDRTASSEIAEMIARSIGGLDALIADDGRFDASVWQYGYEWGQDAAMIAEGLCYVGEIECAGAVLQNTLRRLTSEDGRVAESSRFRGGDLAELNANGALLSSLTRYYLTSGSLHLLRDDAEKVEQIGNLLVEASERGSSRLISGCRDLWERLPWMGVEEGADVATNTFAIRGLADGAFLMRVLGREDLADRWEKSVERMKEEFDATFIDEGRIVHRRLLDGRVSRSMTATGRYHDRRYLPYLPDLTPSHDASEARPSDPDSVVALPIILGLVAPDSGTAARTIDHARQELWCEVEGGYLRSPRLSDPDSPGPWPFATAWMAEAELRTGAVEAARETTSWLHERAAEAGTWMEYYGERLSPPYPPIGIILWGWGQYLLLAIRGWYGLRIEPTHLFLEPRVTPWRLQLQISGHQLSIAVNGTEHATINGEVIPCHDGAIRVALPLSAAARIEMH